MYWKKFETARQWNNHFFKKQDNSIHQQNTGNSR